MNTVTLARPVVKSSWVIFNANAPRQVNRCFALGVAITRPVRLPIGPSPEDIAWLAEMTRTGTEPTDLEVEDEFLARTMDAATYRELAEALEESLATMVDRQADEAAEESAQMDAMEGLPARTVRPAPTPVHHVLRSGDGTPLACVLDGVDPSNHAACTDRAHKVLKALGSLGRVAWIARNGGKVAMLDRDEFADVLVFCGSTTIAATTLEAAFGVRFPAMV